MTGRFGDRSTATLTYKSSGGRLSSVETSWSGGQLAHTEYRYDANGNNVERITTGSSNSTHYAAVFDTSNNLVCEATTSGGIPVDVRHYDDSCF